MKTTINKFKVISGAFGEQVISRAFDKPKNKFKVISGAFGKRVIFCKPRKFFPVVNEKGIAEKPRKFFPVTEIEYLLEQRRKGIFGNGYCEDSQF